MITDVLRFRRLPRNEFSLDTRKGDIERDRELTRDTEHVGLARTGEKYNSL